MKIETERTKVIHMTGEEMDTFLRLIDRPYTRGETIRDDKRHDDGCRIGIRVETEREEAERIQRGRDYLDRLRNDHHRAHVVAEKFNQSINSKS